MAKLIYRVTAPDGRALSATTPDYVVHTVAVLGYMRLRKPLPKIRPDDAKEEIRYDRFKAWVLIGTSADQHSAERLAACQGYKNVTEEVRYVPVVGELLKAEQPPQFTTDNKE